MNSPEGAGGIAIRPAVPGDLVAIIALEREAPSAAHWSQATYEATLSQPMPSHIALVAAREHNAGTIAGFVLARFAADQCELENLVVRREDQNKGVGSKLVHALIEKARNKNAGCIFLEVRESNAAAQHVYKKCGFQSTGRRARYYSDPAEDAILYTLEL